MNGYETTSIGISTLDRALMGGVPRGYTILLYGSPGSGTELFAKQFAASGAAKENVIYFTTIERDEDIIATMKEFGWDTNIKIINIGVEYYHKVLEKELIISKYREEGIPINEIFKPARKREEKEVNFLTKVTYEISKLKPPFRIVIDSLDFFLNRYDKTKVISSLRTIKAHAQYYGGVVLITMLTPGSKGTVYGGIEEIVDVILEMEMKRGDEGFEKYLLIKKVRNHPEKVGIFKYDVNEQGIVLLK
ncbi:RecA-superfamily ATPase possibly involved in signal transduction [Aciduliprofundum sp. MAR08-339]|uniref:RAD55 family ATPase n=1 Tax=Aciduliprofundum sp. (strain MAR08-339) TaxID=673860 RepID=UPI0002A49C70|nr:RecA-superfamily ATPase possibly involved in signal transduction [Aciduliprofundum sp. MAR08-339]